MAIDKVSDFLADLAKKGSRYKNWTGGKKDQALTDTTFDAATKDTLKKGPLKDVKALVAAEDADALVVEGTKTTTKVYGWIK